MRDKEENTPVEGDKEKLNSTSSPHCQCLYEIENNLPRTVFCFMACPDQFLILSQRDNSKPDNLLNKEK